MPARCRLVTPSPTSPPTNSYILPCPALPCPLQRTADGKLGFRGQVAAPNGSKVFETTREGGFNEADAAAIGKDAGEQLKREAGDDFFDW